jgi:hypothetical protein
MSGRPKQTKGLSEQTSESWPEYSNEKENCKRDKSIAKTNEKGEKAAGFQYAIP